MGMFESLDAPYPRQSMDVEQLVRPKVESSSHNTPALLVLGFSNRINSGCVLTSSAQRFSRSVNLQGERPSCSPANHPHHKRNEGNEMGFPPGTSEWVFFFLSQLHLVCCGSTALCYHHGIIHSYHHRSLYLPRLFSWECCL